jgi:hypothetical protein
MRPFFVAGQSHKLACHQRWSVTTGSCTPIAAVVADLSAVELRNARAGRAIVNSCVRTSFVRCNVALAFAAALPVPGYLPTLRFSFRTRGRWCRQALSADLASP